jgi:phospholipid/cholesterol/gamma-HCH transport system substrate-binding protein
VSAIRKRLGDFAALAAMAAVAVGVAGYILANQEARPTFPLIEEPPLHIEAEFSDAQAVIPGQGQSVRVAGVEVGKVTEVYVEDGLAIVGMDIEAKFDGLIRQDASALLRPRTGLKDMFVEVDPGTYASSAPPLEENDRITVENTAPDVDPDEILSSLDTDTRAYLKLLIGGVGKGLDNNGDQLREVFKRFEPLHRDLKAVQGAFAARREALARLVHNYGLLTAELGKNDESLTRLVTASNEVFEAFASEHENISQTVARLPGALRTTEATLGKVQTLGRYLGPTLDDLRPAFRQLDEANREVLPLVTQGVPIVRDHIRPFVRKARPYVRDLEPTAKRLDEALPDLTTSFGEFNRLFNMAAFNPASHGQGDRTNPRTGNRDTGGNVAESYPNGDPRDEGYLYWLAWVANNTVSLHSVSDAEGPVRRSQLTIDCQGITYLLLPLSQRLAALGLPPVPLPIGLIQAIVNAVPPSVLSPAQKAAALQVLDLALRCGETVVPPFTPPSTSAAARGADDQQGGAAEGLQVPDSGGELRLPDQGQLPDAGQLPEQGTGAPEQAPLPNTGTGSTGGEGE